MEYLDVFRSLSLPFSCRLEFFRILSLRRKAIERCFALVCRPTATSSEANKISEDERSITGKK
jgi:hypothetical protein